MREGRSALAGCTGGNGGADAWWEMLILTPNCSLRREAGQCWREIVRLSSRNQADAESGRGTGWRPKN